MKTNGFQAILFDLDGTILEVRDRLLMSCQRALCELGVGGFDEASCWQAVQSYDLEKLVPNRILPRFLSLLLEGYNSYAGEVRLIPGAFEALLFCRDQGYRTAVITGRTASPEHVEAELDTAGLACFIDVIKTQEGVPATAVMAKDHRLIEALTELRVPLDRAMYVGDLPEDISSAQRAGLGLSVAVLTGGINREILARRKPDVILDSVSDLPAYLGQERAASPSV